MRELDEMEIEQVAGGTFSLDMLIMVAGIGAASGGAGGLVLGASAGYTTMAAGSTLAASGAALGGGLAVLGFTVYSLASAAGAGRLGSWLGSTAYYWTH